ncbi:hypothetical protein C497_02292 [Halalkalicoccus jeotgali B3]|uniref:Uncharacterized protein n=1 Tax=Halalkalicoccus jeotgali (strain DSM 18796 / CECT 7217 / JCM 14584 / KCTC 4019 / B3) TaxID=795797 RepID=D8JBT8_HALJB|nr:hypothetical protein HacjB3_16956 [Halalkalicoccus jeotgali B3]ELY40875.1 hypothetical protein C497_02292 [Halalkalicoccus jeotgali B3]
MDVECAIEPFEEPIEHTIAVIILPTVNILCPDVERVLTKLFDSVASTAGLPDTGRTEDSGRFSRLSTQDRRKDPGEVGELRIAVDDLFWDERILEHSSVRDHIAE